MPLYSYHCEQCDVEFDEMGKLAEHRAPQPCPTCGTSSERALGEFPGFILVGDGWPGKNNRIRSQMAHKNKRLESKEREQKGDGMVPSLTPNVGGEQTSTWSEATKLARSQGRDTSGYEKYARKEKVGAT
jgi:putative FmdB family regulatory protein